LKWKALGRQTQFFLGKKERQQKLFFALEKMGLAHNLGMESGRLLQIASDCFAKKLAMTSSQ
jgi:hypothetical protein